MYAGRVLKKSAIADHARKPTLNILLGDLSNMQMEELLRKKHCASILYLRISFSIEI